MVDLLGSRHRTPDECPNTTRSALDQCDRCCAGTADEALDPPPLNHRVPAWFSAPTACGFAATAAVARVAVGGRCADPQPVWLRRFIKQI